MGLMTKVGKGAGWVGRSWAYSIGLTSLAGSFARIGRSMSAAVRAGAGVSKKQYRVETFQAAVERLALTDNDLAERFSQLSGISFLYGLVTVIALVFFLLTPLSQHPINNFMMSLGVAWMSGAKFVTTRFRMAQIRSHELFGFGDWFFGRTGGKK